MNRDARDTAIAILALAILATGSCGGPRTDLGVNFDITEVQDQRKAVLTLEGMVEDAFDVHLPNVWEDVNVWWIDTSCVGREGYGIQLDGQCLAGVMFGGRDLYVALSNKDSTRTCGSALLHEFGHYLSIQLWGHASFAPCADSTHTGPIWDVVAEAGAVACDRGW